MLILRRQATVFGFHRPAVLHAADLFLTGVDHRFDSEGHTRLEHHVGFRRIIVQYLWFLVEAAADTVATVFTYHGETFRFDEFLDRRADRTQVNPRLDHLQRQIEAFLGDAAQALAEDSRFTDDEHF